MRYNIAFLAVNPQPFCEIAQALFSDVSDTYLLSDNSHPHVTVCQFETEDPSLPSELFKEVKSLNVKIYEPSMLGISFEKGTKENEGFYMAQIFIEREKNIMEFHTQVLKLLEKYSLPCINANAARYKPHVTLARIKLKKPLPVWPDSLLDPAIFKITLGVSDQNGQYLKVLYE